MHDRDKILQAIAANQPAYIALPEVYAPKGNNADVVTRFIETLTTIGGNIVLVDSLADIQKYLADTVYPDDRVVSKVPGITGSQVDHSELSDPHGLQSVDFAILAAHFGVAENGAVWITEDRMGERVLPFICQHLSIVLSAKDIVATMHNAYDRIGDGIYGFGTFIAGPSKTADIEQSLVLGAHGARTMTVFLMSN
jgi:L-lactate dehydrogenase complex protein LldG